MPELHLAKIAHENRYAVVLRHDDIAHVLECLDKADAADDIAKLAARKHAAARVGAVGADSVGDVLERDS